MLNSVLKKAVLSFLLLVLPAALSGIGLPGSAGTAGSGRAEASSPQAAQEAPLRFGVLYLLSPKELYERWTPFAEYLSRKTGRKVELVVPRNFDHLVELARSGQLDLLFVNPYVYILLKKEIGIEAVAAQVAYGNTFAPSHLIVRKDSGIKTLDDLRGKKIAFVSHLASSGYVVPRAYLMSQGIDVDREMKVVFTKNLPGTLLSVLNREVDVAGMCGVNYANLSRRINTEWVEILRTTEVSPRLPLVVRKGMDRALVAKIKTAAIGLKTDPEAGPTLKALDFDGFDPITDAEYDGIRKLARQTGLPH